MKINLELIDGESTINYADKKEVFRTVKQIYWHLKQIEKKDYKISSLDLDDLKKQKIYWIVQFLITVWRNND